MSVYKRAEGRWQVLVDFERHPNGSRKRRSLGTFPTRKEAEAVEREAIVKRDRGTDVEPDRLTVAELFERFFAAVGPGLAAKTLERYRELARLHVVPHIGARPVAKLKTLALDDLYTALLATPCRGGTLSLRTVGHVHRLIHRVLSYGMKSQRLERNVARDATYSKAEPVEPRALSPVDVRRVLAEADPRWRPFVALAFLTGARRGELLALRWSDVDFEKKTLLIRRSLSQTRAGLAYKSTKTKRMRPVRLSPQALVELRALRASVAENRLAAGPAYAEGDLVFADANGNPFAPDAVSKIYRGIATRAGVAHLNLHAARHTAATRMLGAGVDVRSVAGILGHRDGSMTLNVYGHLIPERTSAAVDALGDELLGVAADPQNEAEFSSEGNVLATSGLKAVR